ncbi:MAG: Spy/CpxP family protein refolding chaperone [Gemmatimonadota bacterium]
MCGKWRYIGGALVVALGVAVMPLQAQRGMGLRGPGVRGPGGPNMGHSLDLALENQEELGLTEDQVVQLKELKTIVDRDVVGLAEEMKELREGIRAGEVERNEGMRQMEALRGEWITASAPLRGRVQEILTVEQHDQLLPLVRQDRPGGGSVGAFQGRAFQGRGAVSVRGSGMGMGMGMMGQCRGGRGGVGTGPFFRGGAEGGSPMQPREGRKLP